MIRKFKSAARQLELGRNSDVTGVVEAILREVETRGDAAVREYSIRFDGLDRETYRLGQVEIDACVASLTAQERKDIDFAQAQVRRFAEAQRAALLDIEIETLPGVILGHKNIPIQNVGCYVPGGKYPLLASAHMSVLTAKIAGCKRVITCAPPFKGQIAAKIVAAQALAGADEIYCIGGVQAIAAMAYGTKTIAAVDMLAGLNNGPGKEAVAWDSALIYDMIITQPVVYRFPDIAVPTLLMIGQKDTTAIAKDMAPPELRAKLGNYPELGKAAAKAIPGAKLVEFPDYGHAPQMTDPEGFDKALIAGIAQP